MKKDSHKSSETKSNTPLKKETRPRPGQPTKYRKEYCEQLVDHMARGLSFESFGAKIDCHYDTLYEWVKVHLEFSDARKMGITKALYFFDQIGVAMSDPRVDTTKSNTVSWIYQMKCRFNKFGWNPIGQDSNDAGDDFQFK